MRPLEGLFVLDFTTLLPGPMATLLLAEAGAEVVKVERPEGEDMRAYPAPWGRDSVYFALLNRGKKSVTLDLKNPVDRAALAPLARARGYYRRAVPAGRDGAARPWPRRYRRDQPQSDLLLDHRLWPDWPGQRRNAGHDLNYISDAGLLALSIGPPDAPVVPPALIADIAAGAYPAVMNILLALRERDRTGRGRALDIAMTDNLFPFLFWALGDGLAGGAWRGNGEHILTGASARYRLYPCADARILAVAALEDKFWANFCDTVGLEAALCDNPFAPATIARVSAIIKGEPSPVWRARFSGRDCCCSIVATLARGARQSAIFRARPDGASAGQ